jgi:hypothetical protein
MKRLKKQPVRVELLYFVGCPNALLAFKELRSALRAYGRRVVIKRTKVWDQSHAVKLRFLGSPSLRVNSLEVEPQARRRTDFAFACRTYRSDGEIRPAPSREQIFRALKTAPRSTADRPVLT